MTDEEKEAEQISQIQTCAKQILNSLPNVNVEIAIVACLQVASDTLMAGAAANGIIVSEEEACEALKTIIEAHQAQQRARKEKMQ